MSDHTTIVTMVDPPARSQRLLDIVDRLAPLVRGPWHRTPVSGGPPRNAHEHEHEIRNVDGYTIATVHAYLGDDETGDAHAKFFVHAPADLAFLLSEVDRLDRAMAALLMALNAPVAPVEPQTPETAPSPRYVAAVVFAADMTKEDAQLMLNDMAKPTGGMFDDGAAIEPATVHTIWPKLNPS